MRATTTAFYRNLSRIEERMLRAAMPRVSALDGETLRAYAPVPAPVLALTVKLAEVARA